MFTGACGLPRGPRRGPRDAVVPLLLRVRGGRPGAADRARTSVRTTGCASTPRSPTSASSRTPAGRSPTTPADRRVALRARVRAAGVERRPTSRCSRTWPPPARRSCPSARKRGARGAPHPPQPGAARAERGAVGDPHHGRRRPGRRADRRAAARVRPGRHLAARPGQRGQSPAGPDVLAFVDSPTNTWESARLNASLPLDDSNPLGATALHGAPLYFRSRAGAERALPPPRAHPSGRRVAHPSSPWSPAVRCWARSP